MKDVSYVREPTPAVNVQTTASFVARDHAPTDSTFGARSWARATPVPTQPSPVRSLFSSGLVTITDVHCSAPRSRAGGERTASVHHISVVRHGVFIKYGPSHPARGLVADNAHALFFNQFESFRVGHPTSRGDATTNLAFSAEVISEVVSRYAARGGDPGLPFPVTHTLLPPRAVALLYLLRRRLALPQETPDRLEIEESSLAFLQTALQSALLHSSRTRSMGSTDRTARRGVELAETVKEALSKQIAATTSLSDLAVYVGASPFHLARTFHQVVGLPIHKYLLRLRLNAALDRLADPSVRLSRVALDFGFSSASHFTTAFRNTFGSPPREWR